MSSASSPQVFTRAPLSVVPLGLLFWQDFIVGCKFCREIRRSRVRSGNANRQEQWLRKVPFHCSFKGQSGFHYCKKRLRLLSPGFQSPRA